MNTTTTLLCLSLLSAVSAMPGGETICEETAELQAKSEAFELEEDLLLSVAACLNLTDPAERAECLNEARGEYVEDMQAIQERLDARLELCELLGGGAYDPQIEPEDFTNVIDNVYLPLPVGAVWIYEALTDEGLETITVEVLAETREILGVECVSVRDTVLLEGECVEDTIDWYAQDEDGNVWYFGEISFNFEDGFVEDIEGSWLSGVDGAKPGIVMFGTPVVGTTYRQEWLLDDAEDAGTVLDDDVQVMIGLGTYSGCVQTADFTPLEPDGLEHKFYAPGIGLVFESKPGETETLELVSFSL